jgi:hypothetical protein
MARSFPTERRASEPSDLSELVRAITNAPSDELETDALEWKGPLDLGEKKSRFVLAKNILGFGNRTIADAKESFGGYAYILVGVEPGQLHGVEIPDPSTLTNALARFVAPGHPRWRPHRVDVDGTAVLVIEVAAPSAGDRICTLQEHYEQAREGRIFVRRHGQTREASPQEIRSLEERYAASAVEEAQQLAQLHRRSNELAERHVALAAAQDARDRDDRAAREAPDFVSSRNGDGFVHEPPHAVFGTLRNNGGTTATITSLRLHHPGGALPGAAVPAYGSGPAGDFNMPVRIDPGYDVMLRFLHPGLANLLHCHDPLTVELIFESDAELQWRQMLTLRRRASDAQGRPLWTVREGETQTDRWR